MFREYCVQVSMYHARAEGVNECIINAHYYHYHTLPQLSTPFGSKP